MAEHTDADVIGCPACRTILNAKAAGCAGPWHADNRTADPVSHTDADVELVARALADSAYGSPDDHVPWHYTEFGVICACGAPMRDEECLANWDHMPEDHKDNWRPDARAVLSALSAAGRDHAAGVAEGRRLAAVELRAEADDESMRTNRTCCSRAIESWLREAARIAEEGGTDEP